MDKYIFDLDKIKHFGVSGLLKKDSICEICKSDKQLLIHHNQNNQYFSNHESNPCAVYKFKLFFRETTS